MSESFYKSTMAEAKRIFLQEVQERLLWPGLP
jgi:hypothetical protein